MKKMTYPKEVRSLIESFFRYRRIEWLIIQLALGITCVFYSRLINKCFQGEQVSYWLPVLAELFVLIQILITNHWAKRLEKGFFLTSKIEYFNFMRWAKRRVAYPDQLENAIENMLNDFVLKNNLRKKNSDA